MSHSTDTTGKPKQFKRKLTSRQQLHIDDDPQLAGFLDFQIEKVKKFDVFVFELCEGNLSKKAFGTATLSESISICDQLLQGLIELENSKSCHNDLKPENILYNFDQNGDIEICISDFGQAGRTGGTPGWTWPKFLSERKPGRSDTYSVALLLLYTMCEEREVFYRIRNNYVDNHGQQWLTSLRSDPFFKLIIDMMELKVTPKEAKNRWNQVSGQVQMITEQDLWQIYGVDRWWLQVQDGMDFVPGQNLASVSLLDRLSPLNFSC